MICLDGSLRTRMVASDGYIVSFRTVLCDDLWFNNNNVLCYNDMVNVRDYEGFWWGW